MGPQSRAGACLCHLLLQRSRLGAHICDPERRACQPRTSRNQIGQQAALTPTASCSHRPGSRQTWRVAGAELAGDHRLLRERQLLALCVDDYNRQVVRVPRRQRRAARRVGDGRDAGGVGVVASGRLGLAGRARLGHEAGEGAGRGRSCVRAGRGGWGVGKGGRMSRFVWCERRQRAQVVHSAGAPACTCHSAPAAAPGAG